MTKHTNYLSAKKIRIVEEKLLELFSQGKIYGTTHTSIGQELISVELFKYVNEKDYVFSNHRCHGHYIAYGGELYPFFAEVMGKRTGLCGGRGGSQHIHYKNFFSNGIQGGIVGNATGIALGLKHQKKDGKVIVFLGDGTFGEGLIYESFNFASVNKLKILFVVENNHYAMSTNFENSLKGSFSKKGEAFDIKTFSSSTHDLEHLEKTTKSVFDYINDFSEPIMYIIDTYRLSPHSKGDDTRSKEELDYWAKKDYINKYEIKNVGIESCEEILEFKKELNEIINKVESDQSAIRIVENQKYNNFVNDEMLLRDTKINLENINSGLDLLINNFDAILLGEDLSDPYGGAFKVTKNLSSKYPSNIINTSISEAGIVSWATGASLIGVPTVAEIMFGDFLTLAADQLINHAAKYHWLYNGAVNLKMIVRTPMGGGRGYGATHSQSLEKLFIGIPGLKVIASNSIIDNEKIFKRIFENENSPVLFIENKKLYGQKMLVRNENRVDDFHFKISDELYPSILLSYDQDFSFDCILVTYSETVQKALNVSKKMMYEEELNIGVIVLSQISPILYSDNLIEFLDLSSKIIFIEESFENGNYGDYFVSSYLRKCKHPNNKIVTNISSKLSNIPIDRDFEEFILISEEDIIAKIKELIN